MTIPLELFEEQEEKFAFFIALCRLSVYARILKSGNELFPTNKEFMANNTKKCLVDYSMGFLPEGSHEKTSAYVVETALKGWSDHNYYELGYPRGVYSL